MLLLLISWEVLLAQSWAACSICGTTLLLGICRLLLVPVMVITVAIEAAVDEFVHKVSSTETRPCAAIAVCWVQYQDSLASTGQSTACIKKTCVRS
jgi:diacylglycerol kinase